MTKLSLLSLALVTFAAGSARAWTKVPDHIISATNCVSVYGEDQVLYGDDGGIYSNASTWWRTAMCPTPMDRETYVSAVKIRAFDRSYNLDVNCRLTTQTTYDGWITWGPAATTSGSSTSAVTLELPASTWGSGFSNLLCYVPQTYQGNRSGIVGYSFDGAAWSTP